MLNATHLTFYCTVVLNKPWKLLLKYDDDEMILDETFNTASIYCVIYTDVPELE